MKGWDYFNLLGGNLGYCITGTVLHTSENAFALSCSKTIEPITCCAESWNVNVTLVQEKVWWPEMKKNMVKVVDQTWISIHFVSKVIIHITRSSRLHAGFCSSVEFICHWGQMYSLTALTNTMQSPCLRAPVSQTLISHHWYITNS